MFYFVSDVVVFLVRLRAFVIMVIRKYSLSVSLTHKLAAFSLYVLTMYDSDPTETETDRINKAFVS